MGASLRQKYDDTTLIINAVKHYSCEEEDDEQKNENKYYGKTT